MAGLRSGHDIVGTWNILESKSLRQQRDAFRIHGAFT
jgi:hypothetical protein